MWSMPSYFKSCNLLQWIHVSPRNPHRRWNGDSSEGWTNPLNCSIPRKMSHTIIDVVIGFYQLCHSSPLAKTHLNIHAILGWVIVDPHLNLGQVRSFDLPHLAITMLCYFLFVYIYNIHYANPKFVEPLSVNCWVWWSPWFSWCNLAQRTKPYPVS